MVAETRLEYFFFFIKAFDQLSYLAGQRRSFFRSIAVSIPRGATLAAARIVKSVYLVEAQRESLVLNFFHRRGELQIYFQLESCR
jgi:hypothetical protein